MKANLTYRVFDINHNEIIMQLKAEGNDTKLNNTVIKKITFSRDMKDNDFRDMREMLGHKLVQEGTRHIIVAFDDEMDYLAFLVATGQVKMTPLNAGRR